MAAPPGWRRYVGPAAFLFVATVAVLLVRAGLHAGAKQGPGSPAAPSTTVRTTIRPAGGRRFWTVRAGDTFALVAARSGVSVATIARLNPGVRSTSLHIGQKLRLR
jgi:hypothetical protein